MIETMKRKQFIRPVSVKQPTITYKSKSFYNSELDSHIPSTTSPYFAKASLRLFSSVWYEIPALKCWPYQHKITPWGKGEHCIENSKGILKAPPIKIFELPMDDMHRVAWWVDSLKRDNSDLICLLAICRSVFPNLLKKAIELPKRTHKKTKVWVSNSK